MHLIGLLRLPNLLISWKKVILGKGVNRNFLRRVCGLHK